jgi:hypothetical protein
MRSLKERKTPMAKRQAANRRTASTPARMTDTQLRDKGFAPFLRPEHVRTGEQLELSGFNSIRDRGTEREQFACEVTNEKGESFVLGVREGSPDHRKMFQAFGPDYKTWRGTVIVEVGTGSRGGEFVNVSAVSDDQPDWADTTPATSPDQQ